MSQEEFTWKVSDVYTEDIQYKTLVSQFESGKEQRRQKWALPIRIFHLRLEARTPSEMEDIWYFYKQRKGIYDSFWWENENESPIEDELLGSGDGSTTVFQTDHYPVPSGGVSAYLKDVETGVDTDIPSGDYTLLRVSGTLTFAGANIPAAGKYVYADYRWCYKVRFLEDIMSKDLFAYKVYNLSLNLKQIL